MAPHGVSGRRGGNGSERSPRAAAPTADVGGRGLSNGRPGRLGACPVRSWRGRHVSPAGGCVSAPAPFGAALAPPCPDPLVMAGEQHVRNAPAAVLRWAG